MTPEELERAAARHWRAPDEEYLGQWLLRAADGFTGRANSALALGDPGRPLADALAEVVIWYRAKGLPAMVSVPLVTPAHHQLQSDLTKRGWCTRPGSAIVMTAGLADVGTDSRARFAAEPDDAWLGLYHYRGMELPPIAKTLLLSAPDQWFASIRDADGETVAVARLSLDGDLAGLTAVEVAPAHRRQGLGTAITRAAAAAARARGATRMFLQTEIENTPARAMYAGLGFRDSHEYHYRIAPSPAPSQGGR